MTMQRQGADTVPTRQCGGGAGWLEQLGCRTIGWLALLLILVVGLLSACGDEAGEQQAVDETPGSPISLSRAQPVATSTPTATRVASPTPAGVSPTVTRMPSTPVPARTPTPLPTPVPGVGERVVTDDFEITVVETQLFQRVGVSRAEGVFLFVQMTVENLAEEPQPFPFQGLVVVDEQGRTFFLHEPATRESLTFDFGVEFDEALQPGVERTVVAIFDIPADATGLVLTTPSRVFQIRLEVLQPVK